MSLENARVVVIGASGGIGSAVARRIRSQGGHPILMGRSEERLAVLGSELGAQTCPVDAGNSDELELAVASCNPIEGIVNCAGSILLKPAHLTAQQEWDQTIRTNLTTAFATIKAAVKVFGSQGGSIVLCATAAARIWHFQSRSNRRGEGRRDRADAVSCGHVRSTKCEGELRGAWTGGYSPGGADHVKRTGTESFCCNARIGTHRTAGRGGIGDRLVPRSGECVGHGAGAMH